MPIVDIDIVGDMPPTDAAATQAIADALGAVFGSKPQGTWVSLRVLPAAQFAESGGAAPGGAPVFVRILQRDPVDGAARAVEVQAVTKAVAAALSQPPAHVHVIYEPSARGRVAFGGRLVASAGFGFAATHPA